MCVCVCVCVCVVRTTACAFARIGCGLCRSHTLTKVIPLKNSLTKLLLAALVCMCVHVCLRDY